MCGILFAIEEKVDNTILSNFSLLSPRGPDTSTLKQFQDLNRRVLLGFHRLAIIKGNAQEGEQPFYSNGVYVLCNGEIYNYEVLNSQFNFHSSSDCKVILNLYLRNRNVNDVLRNISGEYAFVIFDTLKNEVYFARDTYGVRPLFFFFEENTLYLSSLLKGLPNFLGKQVTPNTLYTYNVVTNTLNTKQILPLSDSLRSSSSIPNRMKEYLEEAVLTRLHSDVPIGFLLSGGFDSSIILSIASKYLPRNTRYNVFTIGFDENSSDIQNSKKVMSYLRGKYGDIYDHHILIPSIEEGLNVIPEVIYHLESYDTTTIRASVPMYILARYIRAQTNTRVLLSGEGSDEVNGSYLYFHYAPNKKEFEEERRRLLNNIHFFDGLRADRMISCNGLELRVPFLDPKFVNECLSSDEVYSNMKLSGIEKKYIRDLFEGYLPIEILYRMKDAFSDAVSSKWKKALLIAWENEEKEYLRIFDSYFKDRNVIPYIWRPKWVNIQDPSATELGVYKRRSNGIIDADYVLNEESILNSNEILEKHIN